MATCRIRECNFPADAGDLCVYCQVWEDTRQQSEKAIDTTLTDEPAAPPIQPYVENELITVQPQTSLASYLEPDRRVDIPMQGLNGSIVGNVSQYSTDSLPPGPQERVRMFMAALFSNTSFPRDWEEQKFNLICNPAAGLQGGQNSIPVVVYGRNLGGAQFTQGSQLQVWGRYNSQNVFVASRVENVSNGATVRQRVISPIIMWFLTVLFGAALTYAFFNITILITSLISWWNSGYLISFMLAMITIGIVSSRTLGMLGIGGRRSGGMNILFGCLFLAFHSSVMLFILFVLLVMLLLFLPGVLMVILASLGPLILTIFCVRFTLWILR